MRKTRKVKITDDLKIRVSQTRFSTVFWTPSFGRPGRSYAVRYCYSAKLRWSCQCLGYFWYGMVTDKPCRHIKIIKEMVKVAGGVHKLAARLVAKGGA